MPLFDDPDYLYDDPGVLWGGANTTIEDLQFEFAGVAFGGACTGIGLDFVTATGFDMPELRTSDVVRPRDHGMLSGTDFYGGRTVDITINAVGLSEAGLETMMRQLQTMSTNVGSNEYPLIFRLPGQGVRQINARLRRRSFPIDTNYILGRMTPVVLQFFATDPRIYANIATQLDITLPVSTGGLDWPVSWPLSWSSSTSGGATFTNEGTFETRPIVTFTGPLTSPNIQNVTTSKTWSSILDLQAGDSLVVDFAQRTVLLNGTASRYSSVTAASDWWTLVPGDNVLTIGAAAGSGSASISASSAWM